MKVFFFPSFPSTSKTIARRACNKFIARSSAFFIACMVLCLLAITGPAQAQHVSTNIDKKITPGKKEERVKVYTALSSRDSVANIEEKLVRLALQGPTLTEAEHANKSADASLTKAKNSWLDLLTISGNYNDQTFKKQQPNTSYIYPKFFFGVTVPIGIIFSKRSDIKIARENASMSRNRQEALQRDMRAQVLTNYAQYKAYGEMVLVQSQVVDDEQAAFAQLEQKFRNGGVSMVEYSSASKNLNNEIVKKLTLQLQQNLYKVQLEKFIGMPLEDALRN